MLTPGFGQGFGERLVSAVSSGNLSTAGTRRWTPPARGRSSGYLGHGLQRGVLRGLPAGRAPGMERGRLDQERAGVHDRARDAAAARRPPVARRTTTASRRPVGGAGQFPLLLALGSWAHDGEHGTHDESLLTFNTAEHPFCHYELAPARLRRRRQGPTRGATLRHVVPDSSSSRDAGSPRYPGRVPYAHLAEHHG